MVAVISKPVASAQSALCRLTKPFNKHNVPTVANTRPPTSKLGLPWLALTPPGAVVGT